MDEHSAQARETYLHSMLGFPLENPQLIGGAPGTHLDDACAQAGLDAIGAAQKVPDSK